MTSSASEPRRMVLLSSPALWAHEHGGGHPLRAERLQRTQELLEAYGVFERPNVRLTAPRPATDAELALFHTSEYVRVVRALSRGDASIPSWRYGFGPGDNPIFEGMFESESLKGGSTLDGARLLAAGECDVAFSFAGGMHHAGPAEASGFCVFNDAAIALRWLAQEGLRAAYIDVDVHHGDGVQWAFFESADVLTISLHQDGRTLFPGTGAVEECGKGKGEGFCINVPLPPGTDDELYLWAFDQVVPRAVRRFAPDILVTQLGVDTHARDPLAELLLTTRGHTAIFERLDRLASRWLALGGGGYDLDVVPRSWALAVGVMARLDLPDALPAAYREKYGGDRLRDREEPRRPDEERSLLRETVERTVRRVLELHGLSGSAREGGMPGK